MFVNKNHPALKHGGHSTTTILPTESVAEFEELHKDLVIAHAFSGKGWPLRVRRMACSAPMARRLAVSRTDRMSA